MAIKRERPDEDEDARKRQRLELPPVEWGADGEPAPVEGATLLPELFDVITNHSVLDLPELLNLATIDHAFARRVNAALIARVRREFGSPFQESGSYRFVERLLEYGRDVFSGLDYYSLLTATVAVLSTMAMVALEHIVYNVTDPAIAAAVFAAGEAEGLSLVAGTFTTEGSGRRGFHFDPAHAQYGVALDPEREALPIIRHGMRAPRALFTRPTPGRPPVTLGSQFATVSWRDRLVTHLVPEAVQPSRLIVDAITITDPGFRAALRAPMTGDLRFDLAAPMPIVLHLSDGRPVVELLTNAHVHLLQFKMMPGGSVRTEANRIMQTRAQRVDLEALLLNFLPLLQTTERGFRNNPSGIVGPMPCVAGDSRDEEAAVGVPADIARVLISVVDPDVSIAQLHAIVRPVVMLGWLRTAGELFGQAVVFKQSLAAPRLDVVYPNARAAEHCIVRVGTTLFHGTAKAGEFRPEELVGDAYLGASLYHSCAVLFMHVYRDSVVPAGTAQAKRRRITYNIYALFEYETTRELVGDVDVDVRQNSLEEELRLRHPMEPIASYMRWVRTYSLRRRVIERAASADVATTLTYAGENGIPDEVALEGLELDASLGGWVGLRRENKFLYAFLRRFHVMGDEHAMALIAATAALAPRTTSAYVQRTSPRRTTRMPQPVVVTDEHGMPSDVTGRVEELTIDSLLVVAMEPQGKCVVIGAVTYGGETSVRDIGTILLNLYHANGGDPVVSLPGYMATWPGLAAFRGTVPHIEYDDDTALPAQRRPRKMARTEADADD